MRHIQQIIIIKISQKALIFHFGVHSCTLPIRNYHNLCGNPRTSKTSADYFQQLKQNLIGSNMKNLTPNNPVTTITYSQKLEMHNSIHDYFTSAESLIITLTG